MTSPTPAPGPRPALAPPTARAAPVVPAAPAAPTWATLPSSPAASSAGRGNALAWWGFGLSFGSVLAAVAGAAALSIVGILVARRTGRAMWPAVVGCAIAGLALGVHTTLGVVHGVGWVVSLDQDAAAPANPDGSTGPGGQPSFTGTENAYLDALSASQSDTYVVYTDLALVDFGHRACDALDGGEDPDQAAQSLDMGRAAAAEVVQVATDVLCPVDGGTPSSSS